jgi:hypothetical protein
VDVEALLHAGREHQATFAEAERSHTALPALEPPRA